uniref:Uncharacterized protein n=1 Tax=Physcomitrium patens TaxID=3218 RepID=A0A2K1IE11_PHYPA|nr:hypothetical protein PHYPA_029667 [Physcomitrium patens]
MSSWSNERGLSKLSIKQYFNWKFINDSNLESSSTPTYKSNLSINEVHQMSINIETNKRIN